MVQLLGLASPPGARGAPLPSRSEGLSLDGSIGLTTITGLGMLLPCRDSTNASADKNKQQASGADLSQAVE